MMVAERFLHPQELGAGRLAFALNGEWFTCNHAFLHDAEDQIDAYGELPEPWLAVALCDNAYLCHMPAGWSPSQQFAWRCTHTDGTSHLKSFPCVTHADAALVLINNRTGKDIVV